MDTFFDNWLPSIVCLAIGSLFPFVRKRFFRGLQWVKGL